MLIDLILKSPKFFRRFQIAVILILPAFVLFQCLPAGGQNRTTAAELDELENAVRALVPDPRYPDDRFILVTLQEAIFAKREGSGGIGACLVRESTGEIIARGHNRQYSPHFRSDLHAEMDLMNRHEDTVKVLREGDRDPRRTDGLVLYSSMEPCPMCTTRIINTGVKKTYYAAEDLDGGMAHKINDLPPYWRRAAEGCIFAGASCSPAMKELAVRLFKHGRRILQK
jgi:tRNA(adenine34) deaminase